MLPMIHSTVRRRKDQDGVPDADRRPPRRERQQIAHGPLRAARTPGGGDRDQNGVATKTRTRTKKPSMYRVLC